MFAGEDDWSFGVGWGFEGFDTGVIGNLGLLDGFELVLQAGTDSADIGLDPNQSRGITSGAQDFGEFAAVFFGVVATFEDEGRASLRNLGDEK